MAEIHDQFDTILILDFGSQYSHLITRRCREHNVYAELMPCTTKLKDINFKPKGIILSGSPYSVYDKDSPHVDPAVFDLGIPILGICYGLQEIAWNMKGKVSPCEHREYGFAQIQMKKSENDNSSVDALFQGLGDEMQVLMPPVFFVTAMLIRSYIRFGCLMEEFIGKEVARIREICGPKGRVIGAVSGGVDSTVAAKLMHEAIGDRFHAIMVDNGVLRINEAAQVNEMLNKDLGVNLTVVDASALFLSRLEGIEDPEQKRKIIGNTFINVFEEEAAKFEAVADEEEKKGAAAKGRVEWLLQGTLYPDVIESISFKGPSATIKTHHNVGGLLKDMKLKLIEPLRELFKGTLLSIPAPLVQRHPFPGPGLAIRILGPVTRGQVKILQHADSIYIEEIRKAGLYDQIAQAFAVLLPVKAVGVMGDMRTYEQVIALRAVQSEDFMTADWYVFPADVLRRISSRITNEVAGINRVTYDISSKPPAVRERYYEF
ncbi:GMP synthase (glutamine-hydrolyzing) [Tephrocybe rancida]|nr:GMP synthase (glutamine-hydrolyzing) [Tephrocybe rancida]